MSKPTRTTRLRCETLEAREGPATWTVDNLADGGFGSLRAAVHQGGVRCGVPTFGHAKQSVPSHAACSPAITRGPSPGRNHATSCET